LSNAEHRKIASKYFYDASGSVLYTLITQLKEYYLFMQEFKLLQQRSNDIKSTIIHHSDFHARLSSTIHLIEFGCGDGGKIRTLLAPWIQSMNDVPFLYHPVDISQHAIDSLVQLLKNVFGEEIIERHINPVCSTFDDMCKRLQIDFGGIRVVMIMGSTIGNFSSFGPTNIKYGNDAPVMQLLGSIRQNLQVGDWFVCAFDMCKDIGTIIRAYDDPKGVTAAFNLNLLARLNRELNFNFDIVNYRHYATYNPLYRQMESWFISMKHQIVTDQHGFTMELQPYDAIQTELSTKYTYEDIQILMEKNSMRIIECYWTEDEHLPYTLCMAQMV
jgi:dimethylhistidine N-methyltransferase